MTRPLEMCPVTLLTCSVTQKEKPWCNLVLMTAAFKIEFNERAEICSLHQRYCHKDAKNNVGCTDSGRRVVLKLHLRSKGKKENV